MFRNATYRFIHAATALGIAASSVISVGCAAGDAGISQETVTIVDAPASVPNVQLDAKSLDAAPTLVAGELFRIDGEHNPDAKLSYVPGIAFSDDGAIVVVESQLNAVLVFDTLGSLIARFGGKGGGPGEFMYAGLLAVASDTVYVLDRTTIHRLTVAGVFIDRFAIDNAIKVQGRSTAQGGANVIGHTPAGLIGYFTVPNLNRRSSAQPTVGRDTMLLQRIEATTGKVSTIVAVESSDQFSEGALHTTAWLVNDPEIAIGQDGQLYITRTSGVSIDVFDTAGILIRRLTFAPERRRVTDGDVTARLARTDSVWQSPGMKNAGFTDQMLRQGLQFMRGLPRAELYPVVGRIIAAKTGELFVERADLSAGSGDWNGPRGPTTWDLLARNGTIIGRTELPADFEPVAMNRRIVVGTTRDDNDVPSILAYRLQ